MKRKAFFLFAFIIILISASAFAGDIAQFKNLGFSNDSQYFMFGQFGIDAATDKPFAEIYIIDVAKNTFTQGGKESDSFSEIPEPGNDGSGGLFILLEKNYTTIKKYNINHLKNGRIVYVLIDGNKPEPYLEFRDFNTGSLYSISLKQSSSGTGLSVSSSFSITVTVTPKTGPKSTYTIGHPDYKRKGVKDYRIKYILLAPDGKSLIFVIEKTIADAKGESIRYMVETHKING
ncbi:MAG: DUF2259 domain-containing protein [Spirochaetales bacterium]|nr:DUF2259 domain-containing protein [Spirochaetales bacterium]